MNLLVDGKVARTRTGADSDAMDWAGFAVEDLLGKAARLEIVDDFDGAWGHVDVDQIEFADLPRSPRSALPSPSGPTSAPWRSYCWDRGRARGGGGLRGADPAALFEAAAKVEDQTQESDGERPVGAIVRAALLAPGEDWSATFVLAWHFPNLTLPRLRAAGGAPVRLALPHALAVAEEVAARLPDLAAETRRWRDTWYDSTLPIGSSTGPLPTFRLSPRRPRSASATAASMVGKGRLLRGDLHPCVALCVGCEPPLPRGRARAREAR